jgi:hypothetical protein
MRVTIIGAGLMSLQDRLGTEFASAVKFIW